MEYQEAKDVLTQSFDEVSDSEVSDNLDYIYLNADSKKAQLDGEFTPDQLEALAVWMRENCKDHE